MSGAVKFVPPKFERLSPEGESLRNGKKKLSPTDRIRLLRGGGDSPTPPGGGEGNGNIGDGGDGGVADGGGRYQDEYEREFERGREQAEASFDAELDEYLNQEEEDERIERLAAGLGRSPNNRRGEGGSTAESKPGEVEATLRASLLAAQRASEQADAATDSARAAARAVGQRGTRVSPPRQAFSIANGVGELQGRELDALLKTLGTIETNR